MKLQYLLPLALAGTLVTTQADVVLVSETFGGDASETLNGTTPDVFSSSITDAGGNSTWRADSYYRADGTVYYYDREANALLSMGSYINDSKGNSDAIYTLSVTFAMDNFGSPSSSNSLALGFFTSSMTISDTAYWTDANTSAAFVDYENTAGGSYDVAAGSGTLSKYTGEGGYYGVDAYHTFSITLDLSTYNGVDDFGSVAFYLDDSDTAYWMYTYTSDADFSYIGLSKTNRGGGTVAELTLLQVPEPSTYVLGTGLATLAAVLFLRRKRA